MSQDRATDESLEKRTERLIREGWPQRHLTPTVRQVLRSLVHTLRQIRTHNHP